MMKERPVLASPRVEVVLVPEDETRDRDPAALYDLYPLIDGGPFNRWDAAAKLCEIYTAIGRQFAVPSALVGMDQEGECH
jgi:hypothetical protein